MLIMTLVMISVAALASVGLARRSLLFAQQAIESQRDLQRRWGARSCRELVLENAASLLTDLEELHIDKDQPWPAPATASAVITLGGMEYRLWLSDEDAKLNLNTLTSRMRDKRRQFLFELIEDFAMLELKPDLGVSAQQRKIWFTSWGQVIPMDRVWQQQSIQPVIGLTQQVTCWGSGKLNLRRVSDQVLLLVASEVIDQETASDLLELRREAPEVEVREVVASLALRRSEQAKLRRWLTDESSCFSLWLELEDRGRRRYHHWVQGDRAAGPQESTISFSW